MRRFSLIPKIMLCASTIMVLAACGGSSGGSDSNNNSSANSVSGTAAKGIVSNGIVTAYALTELDNSGDWVKTQIGESTTNEKGKYSLPIASSRSGPVLIVLTAASDTMITCDIALCPNGRVFGEKYLAPTGFELRAIYNVVRGSTTIHLPITPLTTIAEKTARAQLDQYPGLAIASAIEMGEAHVKNVFALTDTPSSVEPIDITAIPDTSGSQGQSGVARNSVEQSMINAAFLQQLGNSDLNSLLGRFSEESIAKSDLEGFIAATIAVAGTVVSNNTGLKSLAEDFKNTLEPSDSDWKTIVAACSTDCSYPIPLPAKILSNLEKAKGLVENTRGLITQLQAIFAAPQPGNPEGPIEANAFRTAAEQLQEGTQPVAETLGHAVSFLQYYREAKLDGKLDGLAADTNIEALVDPVCASLVDEQDPENISDSERCFESGGHFALMGGVENEGSISNVGTKWTLSDFGFKHTYYQHSFDEEFGYLEEEIDCSNTFGNAITIDLPNGIRMADVEFEKGNNIASIQADVTSESCPGDAEGIEPVVSRLKLAEGTTLTVNSRSKHGSATREGPDFNSVEFKAPNAELSSANTSFTGKLTLSVVRSQNFATLSPDNEMGSLLPKSLALEGRFTLDSDLDVAHEDERFFEAKINVTFKNAENFGFIDSGTKVEGLGLAYYQYQGNSDKSKQQFVITVKQPAIDDEAAATYSYAYRFPELSSSCSDHYRCDTIQIARFDGEDTAAQPLWVNGSWIDQSYKELVAITDQVACNAAENAHWHYTDNNEAVGSCWASDPVMVQLNQELYPQPLTSEACDSLQVPGVRINSTYYHNRPETGDDGLYDCFYYGAKINPDFDLRQVFNPATPGWRHRLHELFQRLDHNDGIKTADGNKYMIYSHRDAETMPSLSDATATPKEMAVYMDKPNLDINKPNRYLNALISLTAKGQNISDALPLLNLKLRAERTGYRDDNIELNLDWQEGQVEHALNINVTAKNDKVSRAVMDDGAGTTFNLFYEKNADFRGTIERDGTTYGSIQSERGISLIRWISWLDGTETIELESLY